MNLRLPSLDLINQKPAHTVVFICTSLILLTILSYFPLTQNSFIDFDDGLYIYENRMVQQGLTWEGLRYAFSFSTGVSIWQPLTLLSFMVDYQLFGLNPVGYHLENLLFHIINTLLLFVILKRSTANIWPSFAVAALFALHPVNVENVAWAVERKMLLSALFFFLALFFYLRHVERPSLKRYSFVFFSMVIGLMAMSKIVALPILLLVFDFWPLKRWRIKAEQNDLQLLPPHRLFLEKIPLIALSCVSVIFSLLSRPNETVTTITANEFLSDRIPHAAVSYIQYIERLIWSSGHPIYIPVPPGHTILSITFAVAALSAITTAAVIFAKKHPWFLAGWFWYCAALLPMSGLVRAGLWPGLADRYMYLPEIGLFIIFAWAAAELSSHFQFLKWLFAAGFLLILAAMSFYTFRQASLWKDSVTLFSDTVNQMPSNAKAHNLLGRAFFKEKTDFLNAEYHLNEAVRLSPSDGATRHDMGELYLRQGKPDKALEHLNIAAAILPRNAEVLNSLASALISSGLYKEALVQLDRALLIEPDYVNAMYNRGVVLIILERDVEARDTLRRTLVLDPSNHEARINLAHVLAKLGDSISAIKELDKVLSVNPGNIAALVNMGEALENSGNKEQALNAYRRVLAIKPDEPEAAAGLKRLKR